MLKTIIVLTDGTELSSGSGAENAIKSLSITQTVNDGQELSLGSVCASIAELSLITPGGEFTLSAGEEFTLYREDDTRKRHKVGVFTTEKPTRASANTMKVTAYDRISWLDKDLTAWISQLDQWPYSLGDFAYKVCEACGLNFINDEIQNGSYPVQKFAADGVTGRQLLQWAGEIAGRFVRATPDGNIEMAWYTPLGSVSYSDGTLEILFDGLRIEDGRFVSNTLTIVDDGQGNIAFDVPVAVEDLWCYQNSLSFEDHSTAAIEKVQLRQSESDVGTVYPDVTGDVNTYIITGNPLLTATSGSALLPVAQTLYENLKDVSYTPCSLKIPATPQIQAGNILTITDKNGKPVTVYVMTKRTTGQADTLECTGSHRRDSSTAVNNQSVRSLNGKVLNLRTDVDGIKAENAATDGRISALELSVDGISTEVSKTQQSVDVVSKSLTQVQQTAEGLSVQVQQIQDNGVSKVTSGLGLTIDGTAVTISRPGSGMTNSLDEKGMSVIRSKGTANETVMLRADAAGVVATDVSVRNYLIIGNHARLEDYNVGSGEKRTACFYLGGS